MNKNLNHLLDSKYYLYNCNLQRDIENNVGEIEIPEFTMEHINNIDKKYMRRAHRPTVDKAHRPTVDKAHACKIYNYNINDIEYGIILTFYNFLTEDVNKEHIYNKDL